MSATTHYTALLDGKAGAYGVSFPDLPGCVAMGKTLEEAIANAADALRAWVFATEAGGGGIPAARGPDALRDDPDVVAELEAGAMFTIVPLVREASRQVRANLSLDEGVLAAIDAAASRLKVTRSHLVETLATRHLHELV
jgi:predicted RNase H-like HicB family nuclease